MYIEATRVKGRIAHIFVNESGHRCTEYSKFRPTIYENSSVKTGWTDIYGNPIKPVHIYSINGYCKEWENVSGHEYHGDVSESIQYLSERYPNDIEYNIDLIPKCYFDIEVANDKTAGFPDPWKGENTITSISAYLTHKKKLYVLHLKDGFISKSDNVKPFKFNSETEMLEYWWSLINIDICMLVGWNSFGFDIPYLINRSINLGIDVEKRLPLGDYREGYTKISNLKGYKIPGFIHYDYMDIVKYYMSEKQESYSLDYIAKKFLEKGKVEYLTDHGTLEKLYKENYQKFIEYNIRDVMLIVELDKKLKLLNLLLKMSYFAKINPNDVYSSMKLWEGIIYNKLKKNKIIVPRKRNYNKESYVGAFVKEPVRGLHKWVCSFDINSLYPNIMIGWNMSSSSIIKNKDLPEEVWKFKEKLGWRTNDQNVCNRIVRDLISGEIDTSLLKKYKMSMAVNGAFFNTSKQDLVNEVVDNIFQERMGLKKKLSVMKNDPKSDKDEIDRIDNTIWALKILINGYYGCVGNHYFRFYNMDVAEGVTATGQYIIQQVAKNVQEELKRKSGTEDDYLIYIDTDSNYYSLDAFIKKYEEKTGNELTTDEAKSQFIDKLSKKVINPIIERTMEDIANRLGMYKNTMKMTREKICKSALFVEKKKYVTYVKDDEGELFNEPKIKVKGVEIVRSSTPGIVREKLKDAVKIILDENNENNLVNFIEQVKDDFMNSSISDIAFPRSASDVIKYTGLHGEYTKGSPVHIRASILYNQMLKKYNITNYPMIHDGEKIRFIYLKLPNPLKENIIAFPMGYDLPKEFGLNDFIDYNTQFEKSFMSPVNKLVKSLEWDVKKRKQKVELF